MAKMSKPFEIFLANIWVITNNNPTNNAKYSNENTLVLLVIMKNQKDSPAVVASDLNLGEELVCILDRIDKCH